MNATMSASNGLIACFTRFPFRFLMPSFGGGQTGDYGVHRRGGELSRADDEEVPVVLRIDAAVRSDRQWCIGGTECQIGEHAGPLDAPLTNDVQPAVLAVRIHITERIDRRRVDTPLESVWMAERTREAAGGNPPAAGSVRTLETPLDFAEVGAQLTNVERAGLRAGGIPGVRVVLDDHRKRAVVRVNGRRKVPAETVGAGERSGGGEPKEMPPRSVVGRECAVEDAAVGCDDRTRGPQVAHAASGQLVGLRIDAGACADAATAGSAVRRERCAGKRARVVVAAIVQAIAQRRRPLERQIGIERDEIAVSFAGGPRAMRSADREDRAVGSDGGRHVDARPLRTAWYCRGR